MGYKAGKKLFDSNGNPVTLLHELIANEVYYLSEVGGNHIYTCVVDPLLNYFILEWQSV